MKFKKGVIVWVFVIALSLITVTFAGAKALYETKPVPTEKRHTISADGQRVYISEFDKNQVLSVTSVTAENSPETPFVFARFEGGIGPDGLTVDTDGNLYVAHFQAGEIAVVDANGFKYGTIRLPKDAGTFATNLAFQNGYLYVTESSKNEIWRIKVKKKGLPLYCSN